MAKEVKKLKGKTNEDQVDTEEMAGEEEEEIESGSKVRQKYRDEYRARGNPRTCSDDFSELFNEATLISTDGDGKALKRPILDEPALREIAEKNGIEYSKYEHLNKGMRRMNVGNVLRGILRRGDSIWWPNNKQKLTPALAGMLPGEDDE